MQIRAKKHAARHDLVIAASLTLQWFLCLTQFGLSGKHGRGDQVMTGSVLRKKRIMQMNGWVYMHTNMCTKLYVWCNVGQCILKHDKLTLELSPWSADRAVTETSSSSCVTIKPSILNFVYAYVCVHVNPSTQESHAVSFSWPTEDFRLVGRR